MSIDIIENMLSRVTPQVYERFSQAGQGNWFQLFADGRVAVGPLPKRLRGLAGAGKFRAEKEAPILAIEACRLYRGAASSAPTRTYGEFLDEIRDELEDFY